MSKDILVGEPAKDKLLEGVEIIYEAVSSTFGARSHNVAIDRPYGRPSVVHDGVTVARASIPIKDKFANVGAEIAFEAADKTNSVGDGTTTATILTRAIARDAHKLIAAGAAPMALREGIEAATKEIDSLLDNSRTEIKDNDDLKRIATISAQNEQIGTMVARAYEELGNSAILTVEESKGAEMYLELKTGMEIDRGYRSPYFVTDETLREATVESPAVLIADRRINSVESFAPMIERLFQKGLKNLVIIGDVEGDPLAFLVANHHKGNLNALAVQPPSFGDKRAEILKDLAAVTGASIIGDHITFEEVETQHLGSAARITSTKDTTLIVEGGGPQEDKDMRISQLEEQLQNDDLNEFDREKLQERLAKLSSGIGVLVVGARSEAELKERKERAIDALSAAQAALQGGVVAGGGVALIGAAKLLKESDGTPDFNNGWEIVRRACYTPFKKLMENAGFDPGEKLAQLGEDEHGIDVTDGELKDMMESGIIDPLLVVKSALANASSAAVMISTTNVIITEGDDDGTK